MQRQVPASQKEAFRANIQRRQDLRVAEVRGYRAPKRRLEFMQQHWGDVADRRCRGWSTMELARDMIIDWRHVRVMLWLAQHKGLVELRDDGARKRWWWIGG